MNSFQKGAFLLALAFLFSCATPEHYSSSKSISSFLVDIPANISINEKDRTISIEVLPSADVSRITPTITYVGMELSPASGVPVDLTQPANYQVMAEDKSTKNYEIKVLRLPAAVVTLSADSLPLMRGYSRALSATVAHVFDASVTWKSSDETVASVDSTGRITPLKVGTTTVSATAVQGPGSSAACAVEVREITGIAAGASITLFCDSLGQAWATGTLEGLSSSPSPLKVMTGVKAVFAGGSRSAFFLKSDGTLWAIGANTFGELGVGTSASQKVPVQLMGGVSSVVASYTGTFFLLDSGKLMAAGHNAYGQFGTGTKSGDSTYTTTPIEIMTGVKSVAASDMNTLVVKQDGTLWAAGTNNGAFGDGTTADSYSFVQVGSDIIGAATMRSTTVRLKRDNTLWGSGSNWSGQLGIGSAGVDSTEKFTTPQQLMADVTGVWAGSTSVLATKSNGDFVAAGKGGDTGLGTLNVTATFTKISENVKSVSTSGGHTVYLRQDGTVWSMGENASGQLGNGKTEGSSQLTPAKVDFSL